MAEYSSLPVGHKVKQGQLFEQGCQFQSAQDETAQIPWESFVCLVLGKIEPTRLVPDSSTPGLVKGVGGIVAQGLGGTLGARAVEGLAGEPGSGSEKQSAYFVLDVYVAGEKAPFRIDTVSTNLRKFLGEEAGYSGELNLVALIKRLAEGAPQALDSSIQGLLQRGKSAVPCYPDLDSFRTNSAKAAKMIGLSASFSPPAADWGAKSRPSAQSPSVAALLEMPVTRETAAGLTRMPASPGALPMALTAAYMIGLFFLIIGAKLRFSHPDGLDDILYWILAGLSLSLAGLGTLKGRTGDLRDYLQANIPILRGWLLCASIGSFLFSIFLGFTAYTLGQGLFSFNGASSMSRGSVRGFGYLTVFVLFCGVASVVALAMALNVLFLAFAREDQILDAPTFLDFIGLE